MADQSKLSSDYWDISYLIIKIPRKLKEEYARTIKDMGYTTMTQELSEHIRHIVKEGTHGH